MNMFYRSINYGGIGMTIAHEMMHALDENGRIYNKKGIYRHWWSKASVEQYNIRANHIRKQFSRYKLYGHKVNIKKNIYIYIY